MEGNIMAIDPVTGVLLAKGGLDVIKEYFTGDELKKQRESVIAERRRRAHDNLRQSRGEFTPLESKAIVQRGAPRLNAIQANLSGRGISADSGAAGQLQAEGISQLFQETQDRAALVAAQEFDRLELLQLQELDRQEANDMAFAEDLGEIGKLWRLLQGERKRTKQLGGDPELEGIVSMLEMDSGQGTFIG